MGVSSCRSWSQSFCYSPPSSTGERELKIRSEMSRTRRGCSCWTWTVSLVESAPAGLRNKAQGWRSAPTLGENGNKHAHLEEVRPAGQAAPPRGRERGDRLKCPRVAAERQPGLNSSAPFGLEERPPLINISSPHSGNWVIPPLKMSPLRWADI